MSKQYVKWVQKRKKAYLRKLDSKLYGTAMLALLCHGQMGPTSLMFKDCEFLGLSYLVTKLTCLILQWGQ